MNVYLENLTREVCTIAQTAAQAILDVYKDEFAITQKDDHSPLTAADIAAHRIIVDHLKILTPDWPILSEESVSIPWSIRKAWDRYWLVDPLDGTREFIKRNGEFTVNIALIEKHHPVVGVVLAPVSGELGFAWENGGAWYTCGEETVRRVYARKRAAPLIVAGSRSHGDVRLVDMLQPIGEHVVIPLGSSLKFLRIAAGEADLYVRLGPTSEWDTAAGHCVLTQAGGAVIDLSGRPLIYNTKESLINPEFLACGDRSVDWPGTLCT